MEKQTDRMTETEVPTAAVPATDHIEESKEETKSVRRRGLAPPPPTIAQRTETVDKETTDGGETTTPPPPPRKKKKESSAVAGLLGRALNGTLVNTSDVIALVKFAVTLLLGGLFLEWTLCFIPPFLHRLCKLAAVVAYLSADSLVPRRFWLPNKFLYANHHLLATEDARSGLRTRKRNQMRHRAAAASTGWRGGSVSYLDRLVCHVAQTIFHVAFFSLFKMPGLVHSRNEWSQVAIFNVTFLAHTAYWAIWNHWLLQRQTPHTPSTNASNWFQQGDHDSEFTRRERLVTSTLVAIEWLLAVLATLHISSLLYTMVLLMGLMVAVLGCVLLACNTLVEWRHNAVFLVMMAVMVGMQLAVLPALMFSVSGSAVHVPSSASALCVPLLVMMLLNGLVRDSLAKYPESFMWTSEMGAQVEAVFRVGSAHMGDAKSWQSAAEIVASTIVRLARRDRRVYDHDHTREEDVPVAAAAADDANVSWVSWSNPWVILGAFASFPFWMSYSDSTVFPFSFQILCVVVTVKQALMICKSMDMGPVVQAAAALLNQTR